MKHLSTKERRRDREEFVYKHRARIVDLQKTGTRLDRYLFVQRVVRVELGYSSTTIDQDIWCSINKTLHKIKQDGHDIRTHE